jgi:RHS repeat-associated protein
MQGDIEALSETWSDYDGDEIYGDFEVSGSAVTNVRSFELGIAKVDPWTATGPGATSYYHGDLIGTTRLMSDSSGTGVSPVTYTAFGERIDGTNPRYGYAGAWGYQAHDLPGNPHNAIPYLHVGARYYDPGSGRFLQRDPIGIDGGLNVYEYVRSSPTQWIDSDGAERHKLRDPKTGRFIPKKGPRLPRAGRGKAGLVGLCLWLIEREVVPRLDKWIEDDYKKKSHKINYPDPPRPPTGGDFPGPPDDGSRLA